MILAHEVFGDTDANPDDAPVPTILLIHGAAEDTEMLTPQARALAARGWRTIAYDRRGTGASTRDNWPATGADQHADDAATLLRELGAAPATVLGFSSGGVVALALAARHPDVVREVIAWEPAAVGMLPGGGELHTQLVAPANEYLEAHPADWAGAFHVTLRVLSEGRADLTDPAVVHMTRNAEAAVRDDGRLITTRAFTPGEVPADRVTIAVGAGASPLHRDIAGRIAAVCGLRLVDVPETDDHEVYLNRPEVLASFLAARAGAVSQAGTASQDSAR